MSETSEAATCSIKVSGVPPVFDETVSATGSRDGSVLSVTVPLTHSAVAPDPAWASALVWLIRAGEGAKEEWTGIGNAPDRTERSLQKCKRQVKRRMRISAKIIQSRRFSGSASS